MFQAVLNSICDNRAGFSDSTHTTLRRKKNQSEVSGSTLKEIDSRTFGAAAVFGQSVFRGLCIYNHKTWYSIFRALTELMW